MFLQLTRYHYWLDNIILVSDGFAQDVGINLSIFEFRQLTIADGI